jgi:hypothetical protein
MAWLVKYEKDDLLAYSHSILNTWKNYFNQLLNVHGVNDVRWPERHTAEQLVPEPSAFEVKMAIEELKKCHQISNSCRTDSGRR